MYQNGVAVGGANVGPTLGAASGRIGASPAFPTRRTPPRSVASTASAGGTRRDQPPDDANRQRRENTSMSVSDRPRGLGHRQLFKYLGRAAAVAAAGGLSGKWLGPTLRPLSAGEADADGPPANLFFGGTDGWIFLPPTPAIGVFHPDNLAPHCRHRQSATSPPTCSGSGTSRADLRPTPGPEEQGPALRAAVLGRPVQPRQSERLPRRPHQPRPRPAARPDRRAHHPLARLHDIPFYDGVPEGSVSVRSAAVRTPTARTPARTCTTATSRTSSTCRWG